MELVQRSVGTARGTEVRRVKDFQHLERLLGMRVVVVLGGGVPVLLLRGERFKLERRLIGTIQRKATCPNGSVCADSLLRTFANVL